MKAITAGVRSRDATGHRALIALCVVCACRAGVESPFAEVEPGVRVTTTRIGGATSSAVFARSQALDSAVAIIAAGDNWEKSWHTLPAGDFTLMLSSGTDTIGFVRYGENFLVASRTGRETLIRQLSAAESKKFSVFVNAAADSTPRR